MLVLKNINIFYGKLHILWDLSLEVGKESVGLFGPNGAGKTTFAREFLLTRRGVRCSSMPI